MKLVAVRKSEQNAAALDPWTLVHLGSGTAAGLLGLPFWPVMLAAVGYEAAEQVAERTGRGQQFFRISGPESPANAVLDVLVFAGGWYLGRWWNRT